MEVCFDCPQLTPTGVNVLDFDAASIKAALLDKGHPESAAAKMTDLFEEIHLWQQYQAMMDDVNRFNVNLL